MFELEKMKFPIFLPDATRAVARSVSSHDIAEAGIQGVVINTFHLKETPGRSVLKEMGGLKEFMNWNGLAVSDSGGFQVMSLVHAGKIDGKIVDDGVEMRVSKKKKEVFTPEKSIEMQFAIGSDIMFVLDDCPSRDAKKDEVKESIERTLVWAKRSREEFDKQIAMRKWKKKNKPKLFGVVQGANFLDLREECQNKLIEIGFDGFGFGGWPVDHRGRLNRDALQLVADMTPEDYYLFGLGIGKPENIVECSKMGFDIFDCVLPTRDARHGRLYVFADELEKVDLDYRSFYEYIYLSRSKHMRDKRPIGKYCDCHTCQNYSRGYITHLFKIGDSLAWRLATIHNLRFYARLMVKIRGNSK